MRREYSQERNEPIFSQVVMKYRLIWLGVNNLREFCLIPLCGRICSVGILNHKCVAQSFFEDCPFFPHRD